ncbi:hypothetical protein D3C76_1420440 [compost metagenome]
MVSVPAALIDHGSPKVFRQLCNAGHQALHRPLGKFSAFNGCIEVVDVGLMVLGVVDFHGLRIDMRFQCIVGVWQGRQGKSHFNELHDERAPWLAALRYRYAANGGCVGIRRAR